MGSICNTAQDHQVLNEAQQIDIRGPKQVDSKEKIKLDHFKFIKNDGFWYRGKECLYAMKILKKGAIRSKSQMTQTRAERFILENVDSPFIVQLMYAFQTNEKLYIVMEFCQGGDIFGHMVKHPYFSENKIRFYAAEILLGIEQLHAAKIVYRDLKPENILLSASGHIKLTDFGLSKKLESGNICALDDIDDELTNTFCGTIEYMAPEIILKKGHNMDSDWWSYGAVIYEMLSGAPPFYDKNRSRMMQRVVNEEIVFTKQLSSVCESFLTALLQRDRAKRLGCGKLGSQEIREHKFFKDVNWTEFLNKKVEPPFIPRITNPLDLGQIDQNFLKLNSRDSTIQEENSLLFSRKREFQGFTYERDLERSYQNMNNDEPSSLEDNPKFTLK